MEREVERGMVAGIRMAEEKPAMKALKAIWRRV
jgi:hypothetical protein